jgi:chemotaxis response regulator CheB
MAISVLFADTSEIMRKAVARLFESDPEIQLVAEAASFSQAVHLISTMQPQVVVLDIHMDGEKSVTPSFVKSHLKGSQLLAISFWNDPDTKALAETFGAATLLDKMNLSAELIPAIKRHAGTWRAQGAS